MKIIYVNDTNALDFDKQNKDNIVFAKYFSPSCPACIAMESEWDNMCKDINEKYNTDLIIAQIDPYVPSILILKDGKKVAEYNGRKNKENMIDFLLKEGYVKSKMTGGNKSFKRKNSAKKHNTKRHNTKKHNTKKHNTKKHNTKIHNTKKHHTKIHNTKKKNTKSGGKSIRNELKEKTSDERIIQSIKYIDDSLRENSYKNKDKSNLKHYFFLNCINDGIFGNCKKNCRISKGLNNYCIPNSRKFNSGVTPEQKQTSINAYKYLIIKQILAQNVVTQFIYSNDLRNALNIKEHVLNKILNDNPNFEELDHVNDILVYVISVLIEIMNNILTPEKVTDDGSLYNSLFNMVKV